VTILLPPLVERIETVHHPTTPRKNNFDMFKRNEQCPAASTLQVTSKYAYIKPTQNQQRSFSQDLLCKPHSRSLLNKYLHDNHDYLAASVLRLWYTTYCYTQVVAKPLRNDRANIIFQKYFDLIESEAELNWRWSNGMHDFQKLSFDHCCHMSVREKDAMVVQLKNQAYTFLEARINKPASSKDISNSYDLTLRLSDLSLDNSYSNATTPTGSSSGSSSDSSRSSCSSRSTVDGPLWTSERF
jgi:hypothetical protein